MLVLSEIYLFKLSRDQGQFNVKFVLDSKPDIDFQISSIKLDMTNTVEPISYYKVEGKQLVSGKFFETIKRMLLKIFSEQINSEAIGIFKWDSTTCSVRKE